LGKGVHAGSIGLKESSLRRTRGDSQVDFPKDNVQIGTQTINENRCKSFLESRDILSEHLDKDKDAYDELFWQEKILSILPAVYP
jgi:hypothetical protein